MRPSARSKTPVQILHPHPQGLTVSTARIRESHIPQLPPGSAAAAISEVSQ